MKKPAYKVTAVCIALLLLSLPAVLSARERRGAIIVVTLKDGQTVWGELIAVKPDSLLLLAGKDQSIDIAGIRSIRIIRKSKAKLGGLLAGRKHGYVIVRVFKEEAVSGTVDETQRPAFQEMMSEILRDGVKTVIVEGLDRLAREYRIQENLLVYLATKGVELISARTGENVPEAIEGDPVRKALVQMQAIFFELEKNQLVLRLKKARDKARQERGKCEGRKRYGEESEEEGKIITRIKLMRRTRRGGYKGLTYQAIADQLNKEGLVTQQGKKWTAQLVHHLCTAL